MIPNGSGRQAELLRVLSSKRCLDILQMMSTGEQTATSLSECLEITMPTLSHYLKMLTNADVIVMQPTFNDLRIKMLSLSERGRALLFMYENEMIFHPMVLGE